MFSAVTGTTVSMSKGMKERLNGGCWAVDVASEGRQTNRRSTPTTVVTSRVCFMAVGTDIW
jgi:hypothetical protein